MFKIKIIKQLVSCLLLLLLCSATIFCRGQSYTLEYSGSAKTLQQVEKFQAVSVKVTDSLAAQRQISSLLTSFHGAGYFNASVKVLSTAEEKVAVRVNSGEQYQWAFITEGNIPQILSNKTGFSNRFYPGRPFNYHALNKFFQHIIVESENTGYPFASIGIDSVKIADNAVRGVLNYSAGPLITFDSISIKGAQKVKKSWLSTYLGLHYGKPFNQSLVDGIEGKIEKLGFLELTAPIQVTFQNSEATVILSVRSTKTNMVNGIVGFFPNARKDGSLLITGELELDLKNLFTTGKRLQVRWQKLKPLSQFLLLAYDHPNVLKTPLHLSTSYELLKEDSSFINRNGFIALQHETAAGAISFFTEMKRSRLLNTKHLDNQTDLPEVNDFDLNYYGVGYKFHKSSALSKPPIALAIEAAVGKKSIKKNSSFQAAAYDGLQQNSLQYQFKGLFQYNIPLTRSFVLHHKLSAAKMINDRLFINDLFRVGGLNSLRGFNENYFFASDYMLSNLELQFHYEPGGYAFVFYDQSWLYFDTGESYFKDYPLGLGAGLNFTTASGLISLAYALGNSKEQPLNFRISKFHFGYIANF